MKRKSKKMLVSAGMGFVFLAVLIFGYMGLSQARAKAELKRESIQRMFSELERERNRIEEERRHMDQMKSNLKNFELALDKKYEEYRREVKVLEAQQQEFQELLNRKAIDRQVVETYESIDETEAAKLVLDLYEKDQELATLLLRSISGRKAGKIVEEMILLNRRTAAELAKKTLEVYKPEER